MFCKTENFEDFQSRLIKVGFYGIAVLPFGPFLPDFSLDPDFFQEIGPEMVRICKKESGFDKKWMN